MIQVVIVSRRKIVDFNYFIYVEKIVFGMKNIENYKQSISNLKKNVN